MSAVGEYLSVRALTLVAGLLYLLVTAYAVATGDATAAALTDAAFGLVLVGFGVLLRLRNPDETGLRVAGGLFVAAGLLQGYVLLAPDARGGDAGASLLALAGFLLYAFELFVRPRLQSL